MQKVVIRVIAISLLANLLSCRGKTDIEIKGQFHGAPNQTILLEELSLTGANLVDSTISSSSGEFSFTITPKTTDPTFYNVRHDNSFVPLLLAPGESVSIDAVGNVYNNYRVTGSEGSAKMRELSLLTLSQARTLDSISRLYEGESDPILAAEYGKAYGAKYIQLKRSVIAFVIKNAGSLSSIVPLYQPIFGSRFIFDEPSDIVYFRVVADSLSKLYPNSPYVVSLKNDMKRIDNAFVLDSIIVAGANAPEQNLPDIKIKDASGTTRSLSETLGKVVLLDFTSYSSPELKLLNKELMATYDKYKANGFEVFQVCVDTDKAQWLKTIVESRLPWITVNDFSGLNSRALSAFAVKKIPTRILINRQGDIVGRDLYDAKLENAVAGLI